MMRSFPILWLTGNSGAGKTTLARGLQRHCNDAARRGPLAGKVIVLDGNALRGTYSDALTLSRRDRRKHNHSVARLAALLQAQGFLVVVAVIAPFQSLRREIDALCAPRWVFVRRGRGRGRAFPYEEPLHPACRIDNDTLGKREALREFLSYARRVIARRRR